MRFVLMCLPHVEEQQNQLRTIDYPFPFYHTIVISIGLLHVVSVVSTLVQNACVFVKYALREKKETVFGVPRPTFDPQRERLIDP